MMVKTLIFVYNADNGLFNKLTDMAHKMLSPETYSCHLCAITYSNFGIRDEWRDFLDTLDLPIRFLYRNELREVYNIDDTALPAIFLERDGELLLWINADEINQCTTIGDLQELIRQKGKS